MGLANRLLGGLPYLLKLLYYLAFFGIVGYLVWRYRREVWAAIAGFVAALREFWESLFGRRGDEETASEALDEAGPAPRAFAEFPDPFVSGMARRLRPPELVRYTFEALEAWAREHGCPRGPEQTPHEFAGQLAARGGPVGREARVLADLYCLAAYANDPLVGQSVSRLDRLWQAMRTSDPVADQPVAAGLPTQS